MRQQLLPDFKVLDTEGRAVFGKTYLTSDVVDQIAPALRDGHCLVGESLTTPIKLFTDIMTFDRAAAKDAGFAVPEDYLYWVLVFRHDVLSSKSENPDALRALLALDDGQSAQTALDLTASWHAPLRKALELQDVPSASTLAFFLSSSESLGDNWDKCPVHDEPGEAHRITLLGDAAHPMPPVGAVGANTAFQDAALLCDALERAGSGAELTAEIAAYESALRERAKVSLPRSAAGAGHFFGMRPIAELKPVAFWS